MILGKAKISINIITNGTTTATYQFEIFDCFFVSTVLVNQQRLIVRSAPKVLIWNAWKMYANVYQSINRNF